MFDTHNTRMNGLQCGKETMTTYYAILIEYRNVTDGRTDRQTDRIAISILRVNMLRDKNYLLSTSFYAIIHCVQSFNLVGLGYSECRDIGSAIGGEVSLSVFMACHTIWQAIM